MYIVVRGSLLSLDISLVELPAFVPAFEFCAVEKMAGTRVAVAFAGERAQGGGGEGITLQVALFLR